MPFTIFWPRERFSVDRQHRPFASFDRTKILLFGAMPLIDMTAEVSFSGVTSRAVLDRALKRFGVVSEMMIVRSNRCENLFASRECALNITRQVR